MNKKYFRLSFIFFLSSLLFSFTCAKQKAQAQFVLSVQTINQYDILVYDSSSVIQKFAAKELQQYLKKIFGEEIQINTIKNTLKSKHFLLGSGFVNDSLFSTDTISRYALIQCVENNNIYLAGYDAKIDDIKSYFLQAADTANFGSLYATYDWLETKLNVHWFFPSYLGEYVPDLEQITIEQEVKIKEPAFTEGTFRSASLYFNQDTLRTWMIRNKVKESNIKYYNHNWKYLVPAKKYKDTLPDIFAKVNGSASEINEPQLCTTNEKLINLLLKNVFLYIAKNPDIHSISLTPNDNRSFCECNNCTSLDSVFNISEEYSRRSNRIFTFYSQIADSILNYYPDYVIGGHAYNEYSAPIANLELPDQFHIRLAINNYGFGNSNCSTIDTLKLFFLEWSKVHSNIGYYSFPYGGGWVYPILKTDLHKAVLKSLHENNINSIRISMFPEWYTQGLDLWLISKMFWQPNIDTDSLTNIYYKSVFPFSKSIIKNFHTELLENASNLSVCIDNYRSPNRQIRNIFLDLYDSESLKKYDLEIANILNQNQLSLKEQQNLLNFKIIIEFLLMEHKSFAKFENYRIKPNDEDLESFIVIYNQMKNSLCLTNNSRYHDPKRSTSPYIKRLK